MKAITTKFLPCTNTKGSRIKADAEGVKSLTISYDHSGSASEAHALAAMMLARRQGWILDPLNPEPKYNHRMQGRHLIGGGQPDSRGFTWAFDDSYITTRTAQEMTDLAAVKRWLSRAEDYLATAMLDALGEAEGRCVAGEQRADEWGASCDLCGGLTNCADKGEADQLRGTKCEQGKDCEGLLYPQPLVYSENADEDIDNALCAVREALQALTDKV